MNIPAHKPVFVLYPCYDDEIEHSQGNGGPMIDRLPTGIF